MAEAEGEQVAERARDAAPVDTGTLRDSISVADDPGSSDVLVGTSVPYGGFVEYGTAFMAAQPYLRPAVDDSSVGSAAGAVLAGLLH